MDNNIYKKVGRKYVPFGCRYDENYLTDGIWYVKHHESCHSHTNVAHIAKLTGLVKVGECPDRLDITRALQQHDLAETILRDKEFNEFISKPCSICELVHKVVSILDKTQN